MSPPPLPLATPPRALISARLPTSFDDSPFKTSSDARRLHPKLPSTSASAGPAPTRSLSSRGELDPILRRELAGTVACNVDGFLDAFFPLTDHIRTVHDYTLREGLHSGPASFPSGSAVYTSRWAAWPSLPTETRVLTFFQDVVDNVLLHHLAITSGRPVYRYVPSGKAVVLDGDCNRKTDILLTTQISSILDATSAECIDFSALTDNRYSWNSIRLVGELKSNPKDSDNDDTLIQLANYARELFSAQPCRRWVHAFTLCGHYLRAWLFDRSGALGSTLVNINQDPLLFLRVVCGYSTMDATAIGYDPSIKWAPDGQEDVFDPSISHELAEPAVPYIYYTSADSAKPPVKLELMPIPLFNRTAIVTRGSVCWKARLYENGDPESERPWDYVVKDQWRAAERQSESAIISTMTRAAVDESSHFGLPRYIWYGDHHEDENLIDILHCVRRNLGPLPPPPVAAHGASQAAAEEQPSISNKDPPSTTTRRPRKRSANDQSGSSTKRVMLADSRRQPGSQASQPSVTLSNRVFSRVVMSPVGRAISKFQSYTELLSAMRDAIKGHRNLYEHHHILHRDVSVSNIMIDDSPRQECGFLVDLDLAIHRDRLAASGASHRTGTPDFMAVGLLDGNGHTARHDLESFFYVLLWLSTYYTLTAGAAVRRSPAPENTIFDRCDSHWEETFKGVAMIKLAHVDDAGEFQTLCLALCADDALDALGPVLIDWRDTLFPDVARRIIYGRGGAKIAGEDQLWQTMIDSCERQIVALDGR